MLNSLQLAKILRISPTMATRLVREGEIPSLPSPHGPLVAYRQLQSWIEEGIRRSSPLLSARAKQR
jgi:hypothetical protein